MTATLAPPLTQTSIGRKILMAGSGIALLGFVIAHMIGDLKVFLGLQELNRYAEGLRTLGEPILARTWLLWILRAGLIAAFVVHVVMAVQTARQSRAARRVRYAHPDTVQADVAARTMRWGGVAILLFLIFHLAHFTWGWVHPGYVYVRGDVYQNMIAGFSVWWISLIYIAAMIALGLHVYHGTWSVFQTLGVNQKRWDRRIRQTATALAAVLVVGYCSMPIAVITGAVK